MPFIFYQQKAEPVFTSAPAETITPDKWLPTWRQPVRRALAVAALVAGVVAPVQATEPTTVDRYQPTFAQPSRAIRYAPGTSSVGPVVPPPAAAPALATTTFSQPNRAVRYAPGTAQVVPVSTSPEATRVDRWLPTVVQPSRAIRYASGQIVWVFVAPPASFAFSPTAGPSTLAASLAADIPGGSSFGFAATASDSTLASSYAATAGPSSFGFTAATGSTLAASLATAASPSAATFTATAGAASLAASLAADIPGGSSVSFAATAGNATLSASLLTAASFSFAANTSSTLASSYTAASIVPPASFTFAANTRAALDIYAPNDNPEADNLKEAIVAAVLASNRITEIVGHRIYPTVIPQLAAKGQTTLAYWFVSATRDSHLTAPNGWAWTRVRFRLQGGLLADVEELMRRLRHRFQGLLEGLGPVRVVFVIAENESDDYDPPLAGSDQGIHYKLIDFRFKHQESLPSHI